VCGWTDASLAAFAHDEISARSCGWTWWHDDVVAISDRPCILQHDADNRPHCEAGPSIAYPDGWAIHCWHGTTVPADWIERRETLTPTLALGQPNIELRRAACEILGWQRILSELNARTIEKDADPTIGELLEVELPGSGRERFLRVLCGTGRVFAIPMPPHVKTALEGNAWSYAIEPKLFKPEVRT
jgi:hypothetical protein